MNTDTSDEAPSTVVSIMLMFVFVPWFVFVLPMWLFRVMMTYVGVCYQVLRKSFQGTSHKDERDRLKYIVRLFPHLTAELYKSIWDRGDFRVPTQMHLVRDFILTVITIAAVTMASFYREILYTIWMELIPNTVSTDLRPLYYTSMSFCVLSIISLSISFPEEDDYLGFARLLSLIAIVVGVILLVVCAARLI